MSDTIAKCTAEQQAEWSALHDRLAKIGDQREQDTRMVALYMTDHIRKGAFRAGPLGLAYSEAVRDYERACEYAQKVQAADDETAKIRTELDAHPYTAEVKARRP